MATAGAPAQAISNPANPRLTLSGTISSHPWSGGPNASDIEGIGYVPGDTSMWIADDNADRIYEINSSTGAYKGKIDASAFQAAPAVGDLTIPAGTLSDPTRTDDFESIVYVDTNTMYVTSGNCCNLPAGQPPYHPTVYKLTKDVAGHTGVFWPQSWQALPEGQDPTAAGWRPGTGMYFGKGSKIKTYDYATNTVGPDISLGVSPVVGVVFVDANTAFVTTATASNSTTRTTADSDSTIRRFDISGANWTANPNWIFPLKNTGMIDARDLTIVGDSFYVTDGYDFRSDGNHPIVIYTLGNAPVPTASFTAVPSTGHAPYQVTFTDTSTPTAPAADSPTSWAWDFGDGAHSTVQNPTHTYTTVGTYTATLVASNAIGASAPATQKITVLKAAVRSGGYTLDGFGGMHSFRVGTGPQPPTLSGGAYWPGYDIARGLAVLSDGSGGYMLDGLGGIHKVRVGSHGDPADVKGAPYWQNWDIARGIALLPNKKGGYVLDGYGGVHPVGLGANGKPPAVRGAPYFGRDIARGIAIMPNGRGGYVIDRAGRLYPFKIGPAGTAPPAANGVFKSGTKIMQGVSVLSDGTGGFTVDGNGGLHRFGVGVTAGPPTATGVTTWAFNIARDVALLP